MIRKRFTDDVFAKSDITHVRETVRMIAVYHDRYAFLEIKRDDIFGCLRHLETLGGGIEVNESHAQAIQRELLEESGWEGEILRPLCVIEDTYNPDSAPDDFSLLCGQADSAKPPLRLY